MRAEFAFRVSIAPLVANRPIGREASGRADLFAMGRDAHFRRSFAPLRREITRQLPLELDS